MIVYQCILGQINNMAFWVDGSAISELQVSYSTKASLSFTELEWRSYRANIAWASTADSFYVLPVPVIVADCHQPFFDPVLALFIKPLVGLLAHANWFGVLLHCHEPDPCMQC